jgi:hypothetical protein
MALKSLSVRIAAPHVAGVRQWSFLGEFVSVVTSRIPEFHREQYQMFDGFAVDYPEAGVHVVDRVAANLRA